MLCKYCDYKSICKTMTDGGDAEFVKETLYKVVRDEAVVIRRES